MKRAVLAVLAMSASVLLGLAPAANATGAAPTVAGPAQGTFWSLVTVHGQTAAAEQPVVVYYRPVTHSTASKSPVLTSGSAGEFSWSFRLAAGTHFWAHAGGLNSPVHTTTIVQASCSVSGPAFTPLPFPGLHDPDPNPDTDFAAFTTNRNGIWAGYATHSGGYFAVLRWSAGEQLRVVDRFTFDATVGRMVAPVGITPGGRIVAAVQYPATYLRMSGFYWDRGMRRELRKKANWTEAWPVRVLDSGAVVGVARQTDGRYVLARWSTVDAAPQYLTTIGTGRPYVMADGVGDIGWIRDHGATSDAVRLRTGEIRSLTVPGDDAWNGQLTAGGRYTLYGWATGVVRFDLQHPPPSGPIVGRSITGSDGGNSKATAAGQHGDIVVGARSPRHVRTATGAWVALPPEADRLDDIGNSIAADGTVAYTSAADGLPHFLRCRPA